MPSVLLCVYFLNYCLSSAAEVPVSVRPGEDATLQCRGDGAAAVVLLEWSRLQPRSEGYVFFYRNNRSYENYLHPSYRGRVELRDESSMKDGEVSVVLKNVTAHDAGTYECRITTVKMEGDERTHTEFSHLVELTVTDAGITEEGGGKEGEDKEGGDKEGGGKEGGKQGEYVVVVVVVCGVLLPLCIIVAGFMCVRRHKYQYRDGRTDKY
ncbi:nectin-4-like [Seriola aureovittata]|uniref:nectin-4-like n=1 Tax=Seriola aureovittata TaxID=2871759 RepID=UPI0024BEC684|nr:nectin-4-like [Seriola aureovittata]